MPEEASFEDTVAAAVTERRKRGPNKPKTDAIAVVMDDDDQDEVQVKPKKRLFPVVLERNYHPVNDFLINGKEPSPEQRVKVYAGTPIDMDIDEAREIIGKGIARRNDPIG